LRLFRKPERRVRDIEKHHLLSRSGLSPSEPPKFYSTVDAKGPYERTVSGTERRQLTDKARNALERSVSVEGKSRELHAGSVEPEVKNKRRNWFARLLGR